MSNLMDELNSMNSLWDLRLQLEHVMKGQALLEEFFMRYTDGYSMYPTLPPDQQNEFMRKLQEHFGIDDSE